MAKHKRISILAVTLFSIWVMTCVQAQEGYPLDGTWRGEWGTSANERTKVVIVMKWDGENINGLINPGPESINFKSAVLEAETWTLHIEADNADGMPIIIEGQLDNIGSYNRTIEGTWIQAGAENTFKIRRE